MRFATVLQILVSAALLGLLASWTNFDAARAALAGADPLLLLLALVAAAASRILMAVKWNVLVRAKQIGISWMSALRIYYVSSFAGIFLPSTVGGDAVRCFLAAREYGHSASILSSIVVERLIGLVVLLAFGAAGGILLGAFVDTLHGEALRLVIAAAAMLLGISAVVLFVLSAACAQLVANSVQWSQRHGRLRKPVDLLAQAYHALRSYRSQSGALVAFAALTAAENVLPILRAWLVAVGMGVHVPLPYYFIVVPVALFAVRLPISFEGFGLREGVYVFFLSLVGVDQGVAFGIGLTQYLVTLVALLPGAWLYVVARRQAIAASGLQSS